MAIAALTGAHVDAPTENSPQMSRRALMSGAAVAATAAAIAVPVMASAEIEDPAEAHRQAFLAMIAKSQRAANDQFWRLYDEAQRIEAEWNVCLDDTDEAMSALGERFDEARNSALLAGVFSPAAVLAKLKLCDFDPSAVSLPGVAENAARMIEWDLERCAKVEWVARG